MKRRTRWIHWLACPLVLLALLGLPQAALGEMITAEGNPPGRGEPINFIYGQYNMIFPEMGFQLPMFTLLNGTVYIPPPLLGFRVDDLTVRVINAPMLQLLPLNLTVYNPDGPEFVVFAITGGMGTLVNNDPLRGLGTILAAVTVQNSMGLDVSAFNQGGLLIADFLGLAIAPPPGDAAGGGHATWPVPPGGSVIVNFRIEPIPEPASIVLLTSGLLGVAGVTWWRRRGPAPP